MKILMTDSRNEHMLAPTYRRHLSAMPGVQTGSLFYVDEFEDLCRASMLNKLMYKLAPSKLLSKINEQIIASIDSFKPDILWIFKGMEVFPETLLYAKSKGVRLVNYNPDHPYIFDSRGSGNAYVKKALTIYDLHISYSSEIVKSLKKDWNITGAWLPFGYEADEAVYEKARMAPEVNRACFVGTVDKERASIIRALAGAGVPVDVYGTGWAQALQPTGNLKVHDSVVGEKYWETLRRYRIQINVFRPQNSNSHNMRTFEVPGIGGIMLTSYSEEQQQFFTEGKEVFFYRDEQDLIAKTKVLLAMSSDEAQSIKDAARKRSVESKYCYKERSAQAYHLFVQLL